MTLPLRRCSICRAAFYPTREWQKTCSPECRRERNLRNTKASQARKNALLKTSKPAEIQVIDEVEQVDYHEYDTLGIMRLCGALFHRADFKSQKEYDEFLASNLARLINDSVSIDFLEIIYERMNNE